VALLVLPPSLGPAKAEARAEHLATVLSRGLERPIEVVVSASYQELQIAIESGEAAIAWTPAAVCAEIATGAARARVRTAYTIVRNGKSRYRSALLARRSAHLRFAHLEGLHAAWVDPLSAGGYLLMAALLRSRGVEPTRAFREQTFLGSHRAVVEAVLDERADVGAVSVHGLDDEALANSIRWYVGPPGDRLEALSVSASCPNDALVLTTRAADSLAERFVERFVGVAVTPGAPKSSESGRWSSAGAALMQALEGERLETAELVEYAAAFRPERPSRMPLRS